MKTVWKYHVPFDGVLSDRQAVETPKGSRLLDVQITLGVPRVEFVAWFEVDDTLTETEVHTVALVGTGQPRAEQRVDIPGTSFRYVRTVQLSGGLLVLHVYVSEVPR